MRPHRLLGAVLVVLAAGWLAGCASNPYQYREGS